MDNENGDKDYPRICGGKPKSRRSNKPHSLQELQSSQNVSRARKTLRLVTKIAKEEYYKRKRVRFREFKRAITNHSPVKPCNRRFFEHVGMKADFLAYAEAPELFISKSKVAYEITDGFTAVATTTSAREALLIVASLTKYGIATYFNRIKTPYGGG